jgi:hypothetical protein
MGDNMMFFHDACREMVCGPDEPIRKVDTQPDPELESLWLAEAEADKPVDVGDIGLVRPMVAIG